MALGQRARRWAGCAAVTVVWVAAGWAQGTGTLPLPSLSAGSSGTLILGWSTSAALNTQVWYGAHGGSLSQHIANWKLATQHLATLSGLATGTTYDLRVESSYYSNPDLWSPIFSYSVGGGQPPPPVTLKVSPASASLQTGQQQAFTAVYSDGSAPTAATWSVSGGTIDAGGLFTATSTGNLTVTASDGQGRLGTASVSVSAPASSLPTTAGTGRLPLPTMASPDPTTLTLSWSTSSKLNTQVWYALHSGGGALHYANWKLVAEHSATLTHLVAGASYDLRIESSNYSDPDLWSPVFSYTPTSSPPPKLQVAPATATVGVGGTAGFSASYTDGSSPTSVSWSVSGGGSMDASGLFTASAAGNFTVTANDGKGGTATAALTVTAATVTVTVSVEAPATAAVSALETSRLTATVGNDPQGVRWTATAGAVTGLDAGCTNGTSCCPSGSCAAIYSAPADIAAAGSATITATSISDPTKTASTTVSLTAGSTWEDLVAFENGFKLGVTKPYAELARGNGVYQPDRLISHEVALDGSGNPINTEVWRLDNDGPTPTVDSGNSPPSWFIPGILNRTPWNQNGSYFDLYGTPCVKEVFCAAPTTGKGGDEHSYLYDAAGDLVQAIVPADTTGTISNPTTLAIGEYLAWDRFNPNIFYVVTGTSTSYNDNLPHQALYAVDITKGYAVTKIVDLPATQPNYTGNLASIPKIIQSYPGENDVVMVQDQNPPVAAAGTQPSYIPYIYMVDVNSSSPTYGTILDQFPIDFSASLPNGLPSPNCPVGLNCPAHDPSIEYHFHDIFFQRDAGDHFIFNYGPKGDIGEAIFWVAPENGDATQVHAIYPNATTQYMSHPALNFDGTQIAYSGYDTVTDQVVNGDQGAGNWVWSFAANAGAGGVSGNMGAQGAGHQGWDGYDPNYIVFDAYTTPPDANGLETWSQMTDTPSDPDGTHMRILVDALPRNPQFVANAQEVSVINGPSQSPDGTKLMFTLPDNWAVVPGQAPQFSAYIAVDHRPIPPTLSVTGTGTGAVGLSWTPYPYHREIAGYHVYRSTDGKSFTELTSPTLNTAAFGSIAATIFTDTTAQAATSYYYAVTAQEYSGLESNALSNVMQVAVGGASSQLATAGTTGWDTVAPQPPSGLTVAAMAKGEWKLTWTPSPSPNVRYYNIYYSGGGVPTITNPVAAQHYLIDSPAANETSYIYWEANPNDTPVFGVVAVSRQDLASTLACVSTVNPSAPCP